MVQLIKFRCNCTLPLMMTSSMWEIIPPPACPAPWTTAVFGFLKCQEVQVGGAVGAKICRQSPQGSVTFYR